MNVSKSPLRKATIIVAGSFLGLAGAFAFAGPASAHHADIKGAASCVKADGSWEVKWTAMSTEKDIEGKVKTLILDPANGVIDGIAQGTTIPKHGTPLVGVQKVKTGTDAVTVKIEGEWIRNGKAYTGWRDSTVRKSAELCKPEDKPSTPVTPSTPVSPSTPSSPSPSASTPTAPPVTIPEEVPAEPILEVTCDTMTIGVDNTKNDTKFTVDYRTSKGETRKLVIEPGKKGTETFSATEGFTVDVTFTVVYKGKTYTETGTIPFEQPAEGCDDGEGGGLPVTGAAAGGVAAGAAGLLAVGGALFFMARRRKVKFTA